MADDDEDDGGKLPPGDHGPLNEGAVGKIARRGNAKGILALYIIYCEYS